MNKIATKTLLWKTSGFAVAALLAVAAGSAHAQAVTIADPWVRATVPGQQATGAFMRITAHEAVTLVGGTTPAAKVVEIHEMKMVGDRMEMRALEKGLPIKAGETAELKPGGYHVMLIDLPQPIHAGQKVTMTLFFNTADGKRIEVPVEAEARALGNMGGSMQSGGHGHGSHH